MLQLYHMPFLRTISQNIAQHTPRVTNFLLMLLIVLIPFSIRHVFQSAWNYQTGAYSDFTSLSLYISDLVLLALVVIFLINFIFSLKKLDKNFIIPRAWGYLAAASIAWLVLELFFQNHQLLPLQAYFSIRIVFLIAFAGIAANIQVSREKLAWLFSGLGGIQAVLAIIQFYSQKSIGLYTLGESHLNPEILGVAKIVSHGTKLIRSYGTFPHPNLLSAFLLTAILFNLYLLVKTYQLPRGEKISRDEINAKTKYTGLLLLLLLNIFGLFLTFSRAGILAFGIGLAIVIGYFLLNKRYLVIKRVIIPAILATGISIAILAPYLSTRTTISDPATKERLFYNEIGEKIVSDQPFLGLGPGTSVLHMKQYSGVELQPWEVQPVHNYYLISWAEWGFGAISLLILIFYPIFGLFKRDFNKLDEWQLILGTIGLSFLVLFLFDHYFYTIWPTQLLLWLIIGLSLKASSTWNKTADSSTKRVTYDKLSD